MEGLLEKFDPRLPYILVVLKEDEERPTILMWCTESSEEGILYFSPIFYHVKMLFSSDPPLSFMDKEWSDRLRAYMYKPNAYLPSIDETKVPVFNVNLDDIAKHIDNVYPNAEWLFVYDAYRQKKFCVVGSNVSTNRCSLISFLNIILKNVMRDEPFIELEVFSTDLLEPSPETEMCDAIYAWLKGGALFVGNDVGLKYAIAEAEGGRRDMDMGDDDEEEYNGEQESDDSKGKDDL